MRVRGDTIWPVVGIIMFVTFVTIGVAAQILPYFWGYHLQWSWMHGHFIWVQ